MCTIAILFRVTDVPLVVAANRDELYARPTRPPEVLGPSIVGGVDALSGGTWLAVNRAGRFAAVTNQRALDTPPPGLRSRGLAVKELAMAADPDAYVAELDPKRYASMNLVWGDAQRVSVAYLRRETGEKTIEVLPEGVHVLCNDRLGSPDFPRADRLRAAIEAALAHSRAWRELVQPVRAALRDHTHVALEDTPPTPHLPRELANELTATCIHSELYGTRSSTFLAIASTGAAGARSNADALGSEIASTGSAGARSNADALRSKIDRTHVAAYLHADGPPCTAPFEDKLELLDAA